MPSKSLLIARAQALANKSGKPRYVVYTSMGWRIELAPLLDNPDLTVACIPAGTSNDDTNRS
jgi:hypothetical protein